MSAADLHEQARKDYAASAPQRDPQATRAADATARQHGGAAVQAEAATVAEPTPVADDANATVEELHERAQTDYRAQKALEAARGEKREC
ncbi:hypothetical protein [Streptomyces sp. HPF1205]|uniref:hypothetical protein n=1 Tax=Streptomyces sp. HPF1205 TaxID=2873262 RepID=UPI001CECB0A9|nr:hypothetical protein [Streptomyces sp. HPF1205]